MNTKKIVVAGPPHSGKSVFLGGLTKNLPRDMYYLFRACPDGEGTWLGRNYDDPEVVKLRRKGQFTEEVVDWYCSALAENNMAPITLVDIGGIPSQENRRILTEGDVDYGIVLAGDLEKVPEWEQFLRECGVEVIAVLHSDYNGAEDEIHGVDNDVLRASVHYLERGDDTVADRPAVKATAEHILSFTKNQPQEGQKDMSNFINEEGILSIPALAETLGKTEEERELPSGRVVTQIIWEGDDLPKIADLIHNRSAELPSVVRIDGPAPAWLVAALVHEVHPQEAAVNSPDGFVDIGVRPPSRDGEGVEWTTEELGMVGNDRRFVKVEFTLDPSTPLAPSDLDEIAPPEVGLGDVVVISGRGPNWLTASVAMAYHGRAAAASCWQPGTGATVSWTHVQDVELGRVIDC